VEVERGENEMDIKDLKIGTVYTNGKGQARRLVGFDGAMALYKTKSKPHMTTGIQVDRFAKWAKSTSIGL
jgi:hypothetical protein